MKKKESVFNGRRLRFARLYNSMTIGDVAKMLQVSSQSISQFENGKVNPKWENILVLIKYLGFPKDFFFEELELEQKNHNTYFRSLTSTSKKERTAQIERVQLLSKIYKLIGEYIRFPVFDLKQNSLSIEDLAKYVREKWQLGHGPITNIVNVMEKHGIVISNAIDNNKKIDAYSVVETIDGKEVPVVVLGNDSSFFRQQFSAAHELGHILTDGMYQLEDMTKSEYREMERFMDRFAGELLIPSEMLKKDLSNYCKTDLNYYISLKKKYCVSASSLIVRAKQINSISLNQYQYLMKQLSSKGYRKKEPLDSKYPSKQPRYLREAMNMMKNDLNITGDRFVDMLKEMKLSLNRDMIERILNLKEGFLSDTKEDEEVVLEMKSNNL